MMMRSTPPRSANLAEMPVPAPAPMIGELDSICERRRRSDALRAMKGILRHMLLQPGQPFIRQRLCKLGVIDVRVNLANAHLLANAFSQRLEERAIGLRIAKRLALGIQHAHSAQGKHERDRTRG